MEVESMPHHSLVNEYRRSWGNALCIFFSLNVEQITSCEVLPNTNLLINGKEYVFDVSDYRGHSERYVFFNPVNGRLVVEANGVKKVYKFEVSLFDENEKF
jgi:hypothetical protein